MKRRTWFKLSGAAFAAAAAMPLVFRPRGAASSSGASLQKDPKGLIDLRRGLSYRILERVFDPMTDGHRVPAAPDGMACFAGPGDTWILMRNHELDYNDALGPYRKRPVPEAYDKAAFGCVTRLVVNAKTGQRLSSNLVLAGTLRNCAGGPSPWGWISCEESTEPGHGYAFLCRTDADRVEPPHRLPGYGRFRHEAACVEPGTHIAYLTEDQPDGCLYRFVPEHPLRPFVGKLQALCHANRKNFSLSSELTPGASIPVRWVDIERADPDTDSVRYQAAHAGAARMSRGEGLWFSGGSVFIASTDGGKAGSGQIFELVSEKKHAKDRLRLMCESPGPDTLNMPDNITVAPWGDVVVAEDGRGQQFLRAITPEGVVFDLARNARSRGEFAGVCFSPDGSTLFANLQLEGITVAITGAFPRATNTSQS